ncbi:sigma-70 family RNA polymerase sigma factor [Jatrophihabitans sp.]|uniref:sigma-70 family RNA polymerase sigma factor n=1 Tax=Jatrophihabitans sp. TaxID=1932789 RepID=UPI002BC3CD4F|nr:sigma-70 family RNA polymerase sigma factor [Jatrophihabitans sp.]
MDTTAVWLAADQPPGPVDDRRFAALYRAQWWPMLRLAQGLVDDVSSAEDVVQDAFAGLYRTWNCANLIADSQAAVRYLRASVVNGARSTLRRRRTVRAWLGGLREAVEHAPAADESSLRSAEQELARQALAALPRRQREVLTLRFLVDLTDAEIAEATGMSPAHVRSAASRGIATLRALRGELS